MRFNLWFIVLLALGPIFILFAGLSAAGGFESLAGWEVMGVVVTAGFAASYLAKRHADEDVEATSKETTSNDASPANDASTTAPEGAISGATGYSSPPCFLHELDPSYLGYSSREEVLALLNKLLEAERAGARGVSAMSERSSSARTRTTLREIAGDEARFCAMLFRHITRLGDTPTRLTGAFHEKLSAVEALDDRLDLLNRGQDWVVHRLRDAVPKIADDLLRADLQEMLEAHERNIERCTQLGHRSEELTAV